MTNMAIFLSSVASLPRKITEKTVKTIFLRRHFNTQFQRVYSKTTRGTLKLNFKMLIFEKIGKNPLFDVITNFFLISLAALSCLQFSSNFLQIDIFCSSAIGIVWDCKSAFSVNFFHSIWPTKMAKMTVKMKLFAKRKTNYRFIQILSR